MKTKETITEVTTPNGLRKVITKRDICFVVDKKDSELKPKEIASFYNIFEQGVLSELPLADGKQLLSDTDIAFRREIVTRAFYNKAENAFMTLLEAISILVSDHNNSIRFDDDDNYERSAYIGYVDKRELVEKLKSNYDVLFSIHSYFHLDDNKIIDLAFLIGTELYNTITQATIIAKNSDFLTEVTMEFVDKLILVLFKLREDAIQIYFTAGDLTNIAVEQEDTLENMRKQLRNKCREYNRQETEEMERQIASEILEEEFAFTLNRLAQLIKEGKVEVTSF
jgi:anthranilate/para-aminobenzoate synthase component I